MDGSCDVDEFEKYFRKASTQMIKMQTEEGDHIQRRGSLPETQKKQSKKKSKDRRGSSIKQIESEPQPTSTYNEYLSVTNKLTRTSISNPLTDAQMHFLRPENKMVDASSAPNSRSGSFNRRNSKSKISQNDLLTVTDTYQYRRSSLTPEEQTENKLQEIKKVQKDGGFVVRSFLTSPKGLVNRGDSFKKQSDKKEPINPSSSGSTSNKHESSKILPRRFSDVGKRASIHAATSATISDLINANVQSNDSEAISLEPRSSLSSESAATRFSQRHQFVPRPSIEITKCYLPDEPHTPEVTADEPMKSSFSFPKPGLKRVLSHEAPHLVAVLGDHRVGKTSLVTQFLTSEHLAGLDVDNSGDASVDQEKIISVSVDNIETMLNFYDTNIKDYEEVQRLPRIEDIGAYLVMYSITDVMSYHVACNLVRQLCNIDEGTNKVNNRKVMKRGYAVIMVGNKEDLVRNRRVLESEAREICNAMGCKFIEVSAGLNHKLDELLVGIVCQVRLNDKRKLLMSKQNKFAGPASSSILSSLSSSSSSSSSLIPTKSSSNSNYFGWFKKLFGLKSKEDGSRCDNMQTF